MRTKLPRVTLLIETSRYRRHSDPLVANRTWQTMIDEILRIKTGEMLADQ